MRLGVATNVDAGATTRVGFGAETVAGVAATAGVTCGDIGDTVPGVPSGSVAFEAGLDMLAGVGTAGVAAAGVVLTFVRGDKGAVMLVVVAGTVVLAVGVVLWIVAGGTGTGREAAVPVVAGAAPVYHGAKPKVCKYSIFGQTMVSQSGGLTRPPVSPAFAFHANQKKLVMGLCRSSTGVPSGC